MIARCLLAICFLGFLFVGGIADAQLGVRSTGSRLPNTQRLSQPTAKRIEKYFRESLSLQRAERTAS